MKCPTQRLTNTSYPHLLVQLSELTGGFQCQNQAEMRWCLIASKTRSALLLRLNAFMM